MRTNMVAAIYTRAICTTFITISIRMDMTATAATILHTVITAMAITTVNIRIFLQMEEGITSLSGISRGRNSQRRI
jgi:hypothetical protein